MAKHGSENVLKLSEVKGLCILQAPEKNSERQITASVIGNPNEACQLKKSNSKETS